MCTRKYCSSAAETGLQLVQQLTSWCDIIKLFVVFSSSVQLSLRYLAALCKKQPCSFKMTSFTMGSRQLGNRMQSTVLWLPDSCLDLNPTPNVCKRCLCTFYSPKYFSRPNMSSFFTCISTWKCFPITFNNYYSFGCKWCLRILGKVAMDQYLFCQYCTCVYFEKVLL